MNRPAAQPATPSRTTTDRPTAAYPTGYPAYPARRSILRVAGPLAGQGPFAGWRGQAQTEEMPAIASAAVTAVHRRRPPRVSTSAKPTGSRVARRAARRADRRRHLRAALTGLALAAALLGALQLLALDGISSARQVALQNAQSPTSGQTASMSDRTSAAQPDARTDIQPDWVTEDTHAAYNRTDPAASPLDLPRCTTSPDTPMPCLAHVSADSRRIVVLEEDASLTALVRR